VICTSVYSASISVNNRLTNHRAGFPTTKPPVFQHVGRYFFVGWQKSADKSRSIFLWHTIDFYRPIMSADNNGRFLSIVCHGLYDIRSFFFFPSTTTVFVFGRILEYCSELFGIWLITEKPIFGTALIHSLIFVADLSSEFNLVATGFVRTEAVGGHWWESKPVCFQLLQF